MQLVGIGPWEAVGVEAGSSSGRGFGVHEKYGGKRQAGRRGELDPEAHLGLDCNADVVVDV